ncbi:MAG: HypC/HybG/HupF family hydrogenase formation chaperone [Candidatus Eremiobacteraeota bacterium]|nr:HypC/HybG/HupF family hydrogenase formation chaperone [Candidatus Eremiobacteraeota bacterium]
MCLAIPTKVISIEGKNGKVEFGGVVKEVCLSLLDNVQVGDYVLLHAGYAIERINEEEAFETIRLLESIVSYEV